MTTRRPLRALLVGAATLALVLSSGILSAAAGSASVEPATAPGNDNFGHAKAVSALPFSRIVNITDATLQASEPTFCGTSGHTVWFRITPGFTGEIGIDTRGSTFKAVLTAFTGSSLSTLDEANCAEPFHRGAADMLLFVNSGTTYYIQAGVWQGDTSGHSLHINFVHPTPPSNDEVASARVIASVPYDGPLQDIRGATVSSDPNNPCRNLDKTIWYKYVATATRTLRVDNLRGDFDTTIGVYSGGGLDLKACSDHSNVSFRAISGTTYYFQIGASDFNDYGNVDLRVRTATPPANDSFSHPRSIGSLPRNLTGDTSTATLQPGEPQPCNGWIGSTVWYTFTPTSTGNYRFEGFDSQFLEETAIYTGSSLGSLTLLRCGQAPTLRLTKGHTYRIAIGGEDGQNGSYVVHVSRGVPPSNDRLSNAMPITLGSPFLDSLKTTYATTDATDPQAGCTSVPNNTVWYSYTASANSVVRVQTFGSTFDTIVNVWSGSANSLTEVGCDDDSRFPEPDYLQSSFAFRAVNGTKYWFQIGGYAETSGKLMVQIRNVTPLANDQFANATTVADGFASNNVDLTRATAQPGEPTTCNGNAAHNGASVWYFFHATSTNQLDFSALSDQIRPRIAAYTGSSIGSLTEVACNSNEVTWTPVAGTDYRIQVSSDGGGTGPVDVAFNVN